MSSGIGGQRRLKRLRRALRTRRCSVGGTRELRLIALVIASTAWLSEAPRARLNDSVTAGNTPWWLTVSGSTLVAKCATSDQRHLARRWLPAT